MENRAFNQYDDTQALRMLYDLEPEKIEKSVFLPFLNVIFSGDEKDRYWRFLAKYYKIWNYARLDKQILTEYDVPISNVFLAQPISQIQTQSRTLELILSILPQSYFRYPATIFYDFNYPAFF